MSLFIPSVPARAYPTCLEHSLLKNYLFVNFKSIAFSWCIAPNHNKNQADCVVRSRTNNIIEKNTVNPSGDSGKEKLYLIEETSNRTRWWLAIRLYQSLQRNKKRTVNTDSFEGGGGILVGHHGITPEGVWDDKSAPNTGFLSLVFTRK